MSDSNEKTTPGPNVDAVGQAHQGVEQAEAGDTKGIEQIDEAEKSDPVGTQAAEQEAADGPKGRGLSR